MRIAYWRSETVRILRQCAAKCKKAREILTGYQRRCNIVAPCLMALEASLRQYNGAVSNVPSLVLAQRFIYVRGGSVVEVSPIRSILLITSKKETLQVICYVLPIRQDIAYSFCFTGAETEIQKIKDDSKIDGEKNIDRRGPSQIGTV